MVLNCDYPVNLCTVAVIP